jgi:hypothetical protein
MRMSTKFLAQVLGRINEVMWRAIRPEDRWHGMVLKAIDGSSVTLMDTVENQAVYPQPSPQKPGCGFPVMGLLGMVNLSHGGWEAFTTADWKLHDARGAQDLMDCVEKNDLILADRAFCSFELIACIQAQGGHVVMRLHQARHRNLDWRKGKKLSPCERLVVWKKPPKQSEASELSEAEWEALPAEMTLRYVKVICEDRAGQKRALIVVSTLLDPARHSARELSDLYLRRWEIELKLRDVKTTLGMEEFAVKSPAMAERTLYMMMIAYNLLRSLMQKAAHQAGKPLAEMSIKGTLDLATSAQSLFRGLHNQHNKRREQRAEIIAILAGKVIDIRPNRREPRAVKRRPKPFQLLTAPRHIFQEIHHKEHYRKTA